MRCQIYEFCGLMRQRSVTFDHPVIDELQVLGGERRHLWMTVRAALVAQVRAALAGDRAGGDAVRSAMAAAGGAMLPGVVRRISDTYGRLAFSPEWSTVRAVDLMGDPREWHVSASCDLRLWTAAVASAAGRVDDARAALERIDTDVLSADPSLLSVSRLPLLALLVNELGDRDLASRQLDLHSGLAGRDVTLLPAVHFGPTDSWLAMMADVAGSPTAAALHENAAGRLGELGARVLELA